MSDSQSAIRGADSNSKELASGKKPRAMKLSQRPRQKKTTPYGIKTPIQKIRTKGNEDSLGVRLALIRIMLGQTQESFADLILTNRQAVAAMEKCESVEELNDGMLFRLYYFTKEVSDNNYSTKEIKVLAKRILEEVRAYISDRTQ